MISASNVTIQFGSKPLFENISVKFGDTVIDTVIMGHRELWKVKQERERLYALPEMTEDEGMRVAELEVEFAEMDGYTAESRAGEFLSGAGIEESLHFGPMRDVAPGWKLRVLLAQALFAAPDILLLDEPTNNLDINAINWLEGVLRPVHASRSLARTVSARPRCCVACSMKYSRTRARFRCPKTPQSATARRTTPQILTTASPCLTG